MKFWNQKRVRIRLLLFALLLIGIYGIAPKHASAEQAIGSISTQQDCELEGSWMWLNGSIQPEMANQVQQELAQMGIKAHVEAREYGETNRCGAYHKQGIDFTIHIADMDSSQRSSQAGFADKLLPILTKHGKPGLGNVKLISSDGKMIPMNFSKTLSMSQALDIKALAVDAITRKVYVIVYDPLLSNGQKLSQYLGWNDHATITPQTVDFFKQASNNKMNYVIAQTTVVTSGWPQLIDGFAYTEQQYLAVLANGSLHHVPTEVDYNKIVNSPSLDICGKLNRGEIDEVWIYNGPWFGFYESRLVGPGAYPYNSPPVGGTNNCNRLLPIMGPSPERSVNEAVHNFGHRMEATMTQVYGSWNENNTSHNWNKFALVKVQSPNYSYSGCGNTHFPPNGTSDYDYGNPSSVLSNCNDFANYPNLSNPLQVAQPVSCSTWTCEELNYYDYWFSHLPTFAGCGPDNGANNWWKYFASPAYALFPSYACISVTIGGTNQGTYDLPTNTSIRPSYANIDSGPIRVQSKNGVPIVASQRVAYTPNGGTTWTSYSELMGLPTNRVTTSYTFPWYNNKDLNSQLRFANVGNATTTVTVLIGGVVKGTYPLASNASFRVSYAGIDDGPVVIKSSGQPIIASERVAYFNGSKWTSFSELMGLPSNKIATSYTFPWYNNKDLNSQLRFANVGNANTTITVLIGGAVKGTYPLAPNASFRTSYAGVDAGPVVIKSNGQPIIASQRVAYFNGSAWTSFSELMGLPTTALSTNYSFPVYNNASLNTQLRFANMGNANTTVTVTIGGVVKGNYQLAPNASQRVSYAGLDSGPVVIWSSGGVPIIASERVAYFNGSAWTSFAELMGLPQSQLSTTYFFPWYNNLDIDSQLRFGVP